jgi:hypothetical protein
VAAIGQGLGEGVDVVVVARPEVMRLAQDEGLGGVQSALAELIEKARGGMARRRAA